MSGSVSVETPRAEEHLYDRFVPASDSGASPIIQPRILGDFSNVFKTLRPLGVEEEQDGDGPVVLRKAEDIPDGGLGDFTAIWRFLKGVKDGSILLPPTPKEETKGSGKGRTPKSLTLRKSALTNPEPPKRAKSGAAAESTTRPRKPEPVDSSESAGPKGSKKPVSILKRAPDSSEPARETSTVQENKAAKKFPSPEPKSENSKARDSKKPASPRKQKSAPSSKAQSPTELSPKRQGLKATSATTSRDSSPTESSPKRPGLKTTSAPTSRDSSPTESSPKRPGLKTTSAPMSRDSSPTESSPKRPGLKTTSSPPLERQYSQAEHGARAAFIQDVQAKEEFIKSIRTGSNSIKRISPDLTVSKKGIKCVPVDSGRKKFVTTLSPRARKELVLKILLKKFPQDEPTLLAPHVPARAVEGTEGKGIHVFIDNSNIVIGFYKALKRLCNIPDSQPTLRPNFDFHSFSLILERGRPTAKKVLVGSLPSTAAILEAEALGYTTDLLTRVEKDRRLHIANGNSTTTSKPRNGNGNTNGNGSASDSDSDPRPKRAEQAVDEILALKMFYTLVDSPPSTLVLASGDAAVGEFSDGFGNVVERFLKKGWNVEVMSFRESCGGKWRDREWAARWGGRFRLVLLEEFVEGFLADGEVGV